MALQPTSRLLGDGGVGLNDQAGKAIRELQGLNVSVLAGTTQDTKIDLAAIRTEDTIISVVESAAGVLTDRTANTTIVDLRATGTLTISGAAEDDTATVNGVTYTFKDAPTSRLHVPRTDADDDANAAALALAINSYERRYQEGWTEPAIAATVASAVVTITATVEGTGGNAIDLAGTGGVTASGATLANGSDTGGISIDVATTGDSLMVTWFNKNA